MIYDSYFMNHVFLDLGNLPTYIIRERVTQSRTVRYYDFMPNITEENYILRNYLSLELPPDNLQAFRQIPLAFRLPPRWASCPKTDICLGVLETSLYFGGQMSTIIETHYTLWTILYSL